MPSFTRWLLPLRILTLVEVQLEPLFLLGLLDFFLVYLVTEDCLDLQREHKIVRIDSSATLLLLLD